VNPTADPGLPAPPPGGLGLTTTRQVVVSALAGLVVGFFVVGTLRALGRTVPLTPWSLPLALAAVGIAVWGYARVLRRQVATDRTSLSPESGVRALVLGKSMLMTGAILAGGHLVYVLAFVDALDVPGPRERVLHGVATIAASALLGWAGRDLERACLVPPGSDPDDEDEADPARPTQ